MIILAAITFESEYAIGLYIESLLEALGIIKTDWLSMHSNLFLHIIQLIFIISFLIEIKLIISKYTQSWTL